jgi:hypothetical protein
VSAILAVLFVVLIAALVLRSGNPNYGALKLSAWIGPGLFLLAVIVIRDTPGYFKTAATATLLCLALFRMNPMDTLVASFRSGGGSVAWTINGEGHDCRLSTPERGIEPRMQAISESGAPARGCKVEPPAS